MAELMQEISSKKFYEFCELWHLWNQRKVECKEAMLQIGALFKKEICGHDKRKQLLKKSVAL